MAGPAFAAIQPLSDQELSDQAGQASFYTTYTPPSGSGSGTNPSDYGFFTLGMNATTSLNANVQHLQLGCGGVNGPGCDIDMNNLSLSGIPGSGSCPAGATSVANCDATFTNPFIRLAIQNPNSLSTRQVVGIQLGAQNANGLLQSGQNTATANGINTLSGYMHVQSTSAADTVTGTIATAPIVFPVYNPGSGPANYTIVGNLTALYGIGATAGFTLTKGNITIPGFSGINFSVPAPTINGTRITQLSVNPSAGLPDVIIGYSPDNNDCGAFANSACNAYGTPTNNPTFSTAGSGGTYSATSGSTGTSGGGVVATTSSCSGLGCILLANGGVGDNFNVNLYGAIKNISANVQFIEPAGFLHSLPINSPISLSLQSQNVLWPGSPSADIAQKGWWLSATNPVYVGNLLPSNPVNLCADPTSTTTCVFKQFANQFNTYLANNPPNTNDLGGVLTGSTLGAQVGTITMSPIYLTLTGVQLATQSTVPNCYGGLRFC